ncbi:MAG: efflux RND transporter permease subunit [Thiohalomonadales bacterium]
MIAWFARNHVAANLLMFTILFAGLGSLSTRISLEIFPAIDPDRIQVTVALPGATPHDVEQGIAIRIEEAVQDIEGIDRISSRSVEGSTSINIDVDSKYDTQEMLAEIKNRVDAINTFPVDAEKPITTQPQYKNEVITVALSGKFSELELREYSERIRDDILQLAGITQVELDGVRNYEIAIELSRDKLRQFKLSLAGVAETIRNSSLNQSAGNVRTLGGDVLIRSKGQSYSRAEFQNIVIKTNIDGSILRLIDIAHVKDSFEETPQRTRYNGLPAVMIEVYRVGKQSAIAVADKVREYIDDKQTQLPVGMKLSYWDDNSQVVKNRLKTLTNSALLGGILVFALLTLFLRPAIAFWVFIGIPISFMGAFLFMPILGITLNVISLFGFILVLGIVVDDAIVTGENVYRHLRDSETGIDAAINGTREVALPVTFGVLTTVAAFVPIAMMDGYRGAIFAQIPAVVIPVLLFSLIESKFVLPSHLKTVRLPKHETATSGFSRWQQSFADRFEQAILKYYRPLLALSLRYRYATLAIFVGVLAIIVSLTLTGWSKFVFFPRIQTETAKASLTMPSGTAFDVTDRYIIKITAAARTLKEKYRPLNAGQDLILNILSITGSSRGSSGSHVGRVYFEIQPPEDREIGITSRELVNEWRDMIGPIPGADQVTFRAEFGRGGDPIDVQLSSQSLTQLEKLADEIKVHLATYPGVYDIADSLSDGKQELQIELNDHGYALGLTRSDIIQQVRNAFYGVQVQRIQRGRDDVRVFVRFPLAERNSVSSLESMLIAAPGGRLIPLSNVATLQPGRSPAAIYRIDRYRTVNVSADIDKQSTNMKLLKADLIPYLDALIARHPDVSYTLEGEEREQRESFSSLYYGVMFVLFVIYCLLAVPFKSYIQPLIVMSVIPFGVIGAVIGHWIMGMDLSIMSLLGLMALIGVVVNDSLVLVDFINKDRAKGKGSLMDSILTAGVVRFRPVMLTSMTTMFGLLPLLFEKSTQAQFLIPMAVSMGFGIIFATFITLILVPANYLFVEDFKRLLKKLF